MRTIPRIPALIFTFILFPALTVAQEAIVSAADFSRMIFDGAIGSKNFAGIPYRFTQSSNREKIVVEASGNNTFRAVHSGPGGRAPVLESIRIGETIYERLDGDMWTSQTLTEYRRYQAERVEQWKTARSAKDTNRDKESQPLMNPATSLVVERMYLGLHTLFLNFPKNTVITRLGSRTENAAKLNLYRSTGMAV